MAFRGKSADNASLIPGLFVWLITAFAVGRAYS